MSYLLESLLSEVTVNYLFLLVLILIFFFLLLPQYVASLVYINHRTAGKYSNRISPA